MQDVEVRVYDAKVLVSKYPISDCFAGNKNKE